MSESGATNKLEEAKDAVIDWGSWIFVWLGAIASAFGLMSLYKFFFPCGRSFNLQQQTMDFGAKLLQKRTPIDNIHTHLCSIHSYSGEQSRQVVAHHYCSHLSTDVQQCVIYDSEKPDARLIGVEYVISAKLFKRLPEKEKLLWHSHTFEVKAGILVAPRLPAVVEKKLMKDLITTYGKTFHFWQVDKGDPLPLGPPTLMMSIQSEKELDPAVVAKLTGECGIDLKRLRAERRDIPTPPHLKGADAWKEGHIVQITAEYVE